jgi:hypothetical protein
MEAEYYTVGDRVKLVAYPDEDAIPDETGTVVQVNPDDQSMDVSLDFMCRGIDDDGQRTVILDPLIATTYGLTDEDLKIVMKL